MATTRGAVDLDVGRADFMPLDGWDYVELWVGNAKQAAYFYEHALGFTRTAYAGPETGVRDRASYVLEQGSIRFVVTSALREDHDIARHCSRHGDGVKDIALAVPDANEAYRQAVQRGARGTAEPQRLEDEFGTIELSAIATYGDTIHTFVNRGDYAGPFKPGYVAVSGDAVADAGVGLETIDHVVGNVELGRMNEWVAFYERVFGMTEMIHFSDEDISTEYSALMSKVMTDGAGKIKFPLNEPAVGKRKSQIEEYLDFYGGPGAQHIAMATSDIVGDRRGDEAARRALPRRRPTRTTRTSASASARSRRTTPTCAGTGSSPTATTTAICCRSSRRPRRTGRRSSSR